MHTLHHANLQAAYGSEGAWQITPVSFALPEEFEEWKQWVGTAMHEQQGLKSPVETAQGGSGASAASAEHEHSSSGTRAAAPQRGLGAVDEHGGGSGGSGASAASAEVFGEHGGSRGGSEASAACAEHEHSSSGTPAAALQSGLGVVSERGGGSEQELWILKTGQDAGSFYAFKGLNRPCICVVSCDLPSRFLLLVRSETGQDAVLFFGVPGRKKELLRGNACLALCVLASMVVIVMVAVVSVV
jgi:hypothetical protein